MTLLTCTSVWTMSSTNWRRGKWKISSRRELAIISLSRTTVGALAATYMSSQIPLMRAGTISLSVQLLEVSLLQVQALTL